MLKLLLSLIAVMLFGMLKSFAYGAMEKDVIKTSAGDLEIVFIGHGSLLMTFDGKIIQIDPFGQLADYSKFPKADLIIITHDHQDHMDLSAIGDIRGKDTIVVLTKKCAEKINGGNIMKNGDKKDFAGIPVEAVPAYNLVHQRSDGRPFHPKGEGNGYVLTFGGKRIYIAGDTENISEMKGLKNIDYAFLPMNLPYTMTPEMAADAAKAFKPKVLYPYHYGETDTSKLINLLKSDPEIEVRIRKMK